jgi:hypothetical protein
MNASRIISMGLFVIFCCVILVLSGYQRGKNDALAKVRKQIFHAINYKITVLEGKVESMIMRGLIGPDQKPGTTTERIVISGQQLTNDRVRQVSGENVITLTDSQFGPGDEVTILVIPRLNLKSSAHSEGSN